MIAGKSLGSATKRGFDFSQISAESALRREHVDIRRVSIRNPGSHAKGKLRRLPLAVAWG